MKNKKILMSLALLSFMVLGCTPTPSTSLSSSENLSSSGSEILSSSSENSSSEQTHDPVVVDFYAINDFHGRIENDDPHGTTIAKLQTYLKGEKAKNPDNFVFVNSGDMFQDTYDSGMNRGELLAKTMPLMECEAMGTGNHEFDWGIEYLIKNREFAAPCEFLSANIYHYDEVNDKVLDFADDLGKPYKIIERSDVKIGLIGIIGVEQITSIMSQLVKGYTFIEPTQVVTKISDYLKGEAGCEAVVVMSHASQNGLDEYAPFSRTVTSISPVTGKRYVDAVFTGHTHRTEFENYNNVPFIQSNCHGNNVGHVKMKIGASENPTILKAETNNVNYAALQPDKEIQSLVDSYLTPEFYSVKNDPVGQITANNGKSFAYSLPKKEGGNLSAWATYDLMTQDSECPQIDVCINNGGRNTVYLQDEGKISKGLIFDSIPFTNKTYVARIKGSDVLKSCKYAGNSYYAPKELKVKYDEYYNVATTDYMLFHKDAEGNYDRFASFTGEWMYVEDRYPCDITYTFLQQNPVIDYSDLNKPKEFHNVSEA